MKNILVYIDRNFNSWADRAVQIQIDNSLELGWAREDIWLLTNFPYEYNGVAATVLEDVAFPPSPTVAKINAVLKLFEKGMIAGDVYWVHDLDAFQVNPFEEDPIKGYDMGVCNYGRMPMWAAGTIFFNKDSQDIFQALKDYSYKHKATEQKAMCSVVGYSFDESRRTPMGKRVKLLNISYNFNTCNMRSNWKQADKPLKVVHFHLTPDMMDIFVGGKNPVGLDLVSERFRKHFI